jgi:DNA-binding NarL/FixJ family response regulator
MKLLLVDDEPYTREGILSIIAFDKLEIDEVFSAEDGLSGLAMAKEYQPDIILTGGWGLVSNILHDEIFADDAEWIRPHEETALWYYKSSLVCTGKETLVVSMPHPNRAAKNWTLELEKVLRATGRS